MCGKYVRAKENSSRLFHVVEEKVNYLLRAQKLNILLLQILREHWLLTCYYVGYS